jgi:hypothetical protein
LGFDSSYFFHLHEITELVSLEKVLQASALAFFCGRGAAFGKGTAL